MLGAVTAALKVPLRPAPPMQTATQHKGLTQALVQNVAPPSRIMEGGKSAPGQQPAGLHVIDSRPAAMPLIAHSAKAHILPPAT
jgi:hypothetical protein